MVKMRSRKEIESKLAGVKTIAEFREIVMIELLLDIRELLLPKEVTLRFDPPSPQGLRDYLPDR